jgi:hypothetical protein
VAKVGVVLNRRRGNQLTRPLLMPRFVPAKIGRRMKIGAPYFSQDAIADPLTSARERGQSGLGNMSKDVAIGRRKRASETGD